MKRRDLDDYADLIDEWHKGDSEMSLHEYLGLTFNEYAALINPACSSRMRDAGAKPWSDMWIYDPNWPKLLDKLTRNKDDI